MTVIQLPGRSYYSEANFNSIASSSKGTASGSFTFDFSGKACEYSNPPPKSDVTFFYCF